MNSQDDLILIINQNERTAIIYSIDDLGNYLVEIRYQEQRYFVGTIEMPTTFSNLADARCAAKNHAAKTAFLALSKTFEEVDMTTDRGSAFKKRYDYISIDL